VVAAGCATSVDVEARNARPVPASASSTAPAPTAPTSTPPPPPAATTPATTAPGSPVVLQSDGNRTPQPYDEPLSAAILDIQAYWRATFPAVYGRAYSDLKGGIWPVYPGARGVPGCGTPRTRFG